MPEGPEIFLAARAVHAAVALQPNALELHHPVLAAKARSLRDVPIARVHARSKAMLTEFANGVVLYSPTSSMANGWCTVRANPCWQNRCVW